MAQKRASFRIGSVINTSMKLQKTMREALPIRERQGPSSAMGGIAVQAPRMRGGKQQRARSLAHSQRQGLPLPKLRSWGV